MAVDVLLGLQWGDEGKGKIVDYLAEKYDYICRFQGGPNAGHTIVIGDQKFVLHTIPSGVFRPNVINIIGNGVVVDPITLRRELLQLQEHGIDTSSILMARKAHLILPTHRYLDAASEAAKGKQKIGSTLRGIGPTYMDKTGRNGLRLGDIELSNFKEKYTQLKQKHLELLSIYPELEFDLEVKELVWFEAIKFLRDYQFINCSYVVNKAIAEGKKILAEGAQGSMLDIDFGTYPFVTSSNTMTSGVCNGLGIAPKHIGTVYGIAKAYCTRVGSGPFPTELTDDVGENLRQAGHEFGATTGRPRRCGWIDIPQLKYSIMHNGVDQLCITKLDVLNSFKSFGAVPYYEVNGESTQELPYDLTNIDVNPQVENIEGWDQNLETMEYDALPAALKNYLNYLEEHLGVPIKMISAGPERTNLYLR